MITENYHVEVLPSDLCESLRDRAAMWAFEEPHDLVVVEQIIAVLPQKFEITQ